MPAPIGNEYYLLRSKDGRDSEYTVESLLEGANDYFKWCLENPLMEAQIVRGNRIEETTLPTKDSEGETKDVKTKTVIPYDIAHLPKMRPFTIEGLCNFLEICVKTFNNYSKKEDFLQVTTRIKQIIYNQKFEGAASGFLNANIIARDLGLTDNKNIEINDKIPKTKEEREARIEQLKEKLNDHK